MLPEIGAAELLVIAIAALIVVGPKDLPMLLRRLGQFMAKVRGMAAEFRASFDEMARQSELDELRREVEAMRRGQITEIAAGAGEAEMRETVGDIEQSLSDVGVQLHPPMSYQYGETQAPPPDEAAEAPKPKRPRKPRTAAAKPADPAAKPAARTKTAAKPRPRPKKSAES